MHSESELLVWILVSHIVGIGVGGILWHLAFSGFDRPRRSTTAEILHELNESKRIDNAAWQYSGPVARGGQRVQPPPGIRKPDPPPPPPPKK